MPDSEANYLISAVSIFRQKIWKGAKYGQVMMLLLLKKKILIVECLRNVSKCLLTKCFEIACTT